MAEYSLFYNALIHMKNAYRILGAISVVLLILLSAAVSAGIVRPVKQLSFQVDRLSPKSSSLKLPIRRKDEVGRLAASFNSLLERVQEANREKAEIEQGKLGLEYKVLQSQIQPHFLLNIHMCVSSLLEQGKIEDARQMLQALDSLLRKSTDKIGQSITLAEEIEAIRQYEKLQRLRIGDTFDIFIENWEPYKDAKVPKLLLQPIVENSIYHGFTNLDRRGEIRIHCLKIDDFLHIIIEDNGHGIPQDTLNQISSYNISDNPDKHGMVSIGIDNVRQRISNIYGEGCGLYVLSRQNIGTRVEIVVRMTLP